MRYIKGVVFSNTYTGGYSNDVAKASLAEMQKQSGCNTVVFVISAIQDCAKDSKIDFNHVHIPKDQEIKDIIIYAKNIGLQTILKPEIICKDGCSQTDIARYHEEENEDSYWFQEYTRFIMHYAKIAEDVACDMFIIGCELVELEKKENYWRNLICQVRKVYQGFITYNADRCKEENIMWWDALDYISANGFYKHNELTSQIHRIEKIRKKYNKPFFFSEVGCRSCQGAAQEPSNWRCQGPMDLQEQKKYFDDFFHACQGMDCLSGVVVYNWLQKKKTDYEYTDIGYNIYGKPACEAIRNVWENQKEL